MLLETVRRTIRRHDLAPPGTRVVVALSGGGDSVALALLLRELDEAGEVSVTGVAHFNHQLRDAAGRDEAFCRSFSAELGWPFLADREDVRARAAREHRSIEDAARAARHEFFARARAHFSADVIAVGHTRDDQAETFLLRLLRGAGPRGLSAMHPRSGDIIRPLLDCRRPALRAHLDELGVAYVEDETNADVAIPRNRVRAELLPLLEARFNPAIVDALSSQAALARDEWLWMAEQAVDDLRIASLLAMPRALRRLAVWRAMNEAAGGRTVSLSHVEAVLDLLESPGTGGSIDAPGHVVERVGDRVVLRSGRSDDAQAARAFFRYPLSIPGEVALPEQGLVVSAELRGAAAAGARAPGATVGNRATAVIAADGWRAPLAVRNRRPGDRFRPFGLDGQKKLQDFLVDRKVARADRDRVPLVVDENDRILWVAGHEIDEAFRVTAASRAVLILTLRQV
jgi:tRNA(Ile)-lysidine synthase